MIVDIHTHTFPDRIAAVAVGKLQEQGGIPAYTDGTLEGLRRSMERSGIDRSVVLPVATNPGQVVRINDASARINERTEQTGVLSLGCIHPDFEDYKGELRRVHALGLRGIKIHPAYQGVDFDDVRYVRILDEANALGLAVVVHGGLDGAFPDRIWCTPEQVLRVLAQVDGQKLVLAHMGGWGIWDRVEELLVGAPVCMDTSYSIGRLNTLPGRETDWQLMEREQFVRIVRRHGANRILFGTDSPWAGQKETVDEFMDMPLTGEERRAILSGNACRLLGVDWDTAGGEERG